MTSDTPQQPSGVPRAGMTERDIVEELRRLEESLWREETRFDRAYMERLLAPGYFEFGRSGRVWTREETVGLRRRMIRARLPLPRFAVQLISPMVALVTYRSEGLADDVEVGNRSSLWTKTDDGWKLVFHQGTPTNR